MSRFQEVLTRIDSALDEAVAALDRFKPGNIAADDKGGGDPVTAADRTVDSLLKRILPRDDDGWLSEETADDLRRLDRKYVWIVDPLDGTREFVAGIPEWCVSIGFIEDGYPVAGGICNPATGEKFLGAVDFGLTYNGERVPMASRPSLDGAVIPASRSEVKRGEWEKFKDYPFAVRPMGSVAYKLALVAAGRADATWTLVPKHEWDVAAGAALIKSAGGFVRKLDDNEPLFNRRDTLLRGLWAGPQQLYEEIKRVIAPFIK
jgi:myo-inositol-1(or 4)-monophosphatase